MLKNILPPLLLVAVVAGIALGVVGLLRSDNVDASNHSATRFFSASSVPMGGEIEVRITVADYGRFGGVVETLPPGFTYVEGSITPSGTRVKVNAQTVTFSLFGEEESLTYRVTVSDTAGGYTFTGLLRDDARDDQNIEGASMVTVTAGDGETPDPSPPPSPEPSGPSATRSFSLASMAAGGEVTVTIAATNYGQLGQVVETLPAGFAYVEDSASIRARVDGQDVTFTLQGVNESFTYKVTASSIEETHTFSGTLTDSDRNIYDVGGASSVTVTAPTPTPGPGSRTFSTLRVNPGSTLTVTITVGDYGRLGRVVETLPAGFAYVEDSITPSDIGVVVDGQTVTFTFVGETSFTYRVTAPSSRGTYSFSGVLTDSDRMKTSIGGTSSIRVDTRRQPPPQPLQPPSATSTPRPTPTPTPMPTLTPTPMPTATPTPMPTLTPTPMPTPTPTPMPTLTPTPMPTATPQPTATPRPTATATVIPTATPVPPATAIPTAVPTEIPPTPTVAPTATTVPPAPTPTVAPTPTPVTPEEEGGGFPVWAIVLIVIAAVLVVGAVILYIVRTRLR